MEREYITTDISLRELSRKHGVGSHSLVVDQSRKHDWPAKREAYRARESESFIEKHAARHADRQAEIKDKVLDAIDEAITKFRQDMRATEKKLVNEEWVEVPAWYMKPRDLCLLIDRFEVLFGRPSVISQHQGLTVTSELSVESLSEFLERTRGLAGPPRMEESPLPRRKRLED
jgi:hypothetical protein